MAAVATGHRQTTFHFLKFQIMSHEHARLDHFENRRTIIKSQASSCCQSINPIYTMKTRRQSQGSDETELPSRPPPPPPRIERRSSSQLREEEGETRGESNTRSGTRNDPVIVARQPTQGAVTQTTAATQPNHWILRLRSTESRDGRSSPKILKVHVSSNMSVDLLASCLQQVTRTTSGPTVGLFNEQDGVFLPLDVIIAQPRPDAIFQLQLRPPPSIPTIKPWWQHTELWIVISMIMIAGLTVVFWSLIASTLAKSAEFLYNNTIEYPLQELYRNGPWFVGFEGEPLPNICARITYHGDYTFWSRNLDECQRIYLQKQNAWLRLARPVLYTIIGIVTLTLLRLLIWEWNASRRATARPPSEREMVETYRAIQVLLGLVRRSIQQDHRGAGTLQPPNANAKR